jgi:signal transduction histidine kinase
LTSIINYVDLLKKLDIQDPVEREYIDVLDRKSQRLKTLTEDLVEASKAATGVLTVNLQKIEAGQLIQQALGEYQERLDGAELIIVSQIPKEPVYIQADGRHLWRILDNLLSNCAKYAMPRTRVYVTVEEKQDCVSISVKNISAEPLNVPPEELVERFVRGDSSRTNEGSGLGLSIAQSLAQIQGAELRISVDGDLFKAEIYFPKTNKTHLI